MKAKELRQYLDKFLTSPAAQQARVQIELLHLVRLVTLGICLDIVLILLLSYIVFI